MYHSFFRSLDEKTPEQRHYVYLNLTLPNKRIQDSILAYQKRHPGCKINLWINSTSYSRFGSLNEGLNSFLAWAYQYNIIIRDIAKCPLKGTIPHHSLIQELAPNVLTYFCENYENGRYNSTHEANVVAAQELCGKLIFSQFGGEYTYAEQAEGYQLVPKKLHFVWLGSVLPVEYLINIVAWAQQNPDYELNLWLDSATFTEANPEKNTDPQHAHSQRQYEELKIWAEQNNLKIQNLAKTSSENNKPEFGRADVYHILPPVYNDQINGSDANYASASDMVRITALAVEGGVYVDVNDCLPGAIPLGDIYLKDIMNSRSTNDFLVAPPNYPSYPALIRKMTEQFARCYASSHAVFHHRSKTCQNDDTLKDSKISARVQTTIHYTGPGIFSAETGFELGVRYSRRYENSGTWYGSRLPNDYKAIYPLFRSIIREAFYELLFRLGKKLPVTVPNRNEVLNVLNTLADSFYIYTTDFPLSETAKIIDSVLEKQKDIITNLLELFKEDESLLQPLLHLNKIADGTERFLNYCREHISPEEFNAFVTKLSFRYRSTGQLDGDCFIKLLATTEQFSPEILQDYLPQGTSNAPIYKA